MTRHHEYAVGTPEMLKNDKARQRRSSERSEKIQRVMNGPVGFGLAVMACLALGVGSYKTFLAMHEEKRKAREAVLLEIEADCLGRGGTYTLTRSAVSYDAAYCIADGELLYMIDGLSASPDDIAKQFAFASIQH